MSSVIYEQVYRLIDSLPVISTHEHHLPDDFHHHLTLDRILEPLRSYVGWVVDARPGTDHASRSEYLRQCRHNSYWVWLEKGIQRVCALEDKITADNWDDVSQQITQQHANLNAHIDILTQTGRYRRAIQDTYWDPGDPVGHPELFATTFRVDTFQRGFHPDVRDHDDMNPFVHYPNAPQDSFDDYLEFVEMLATRSRAAGSVALKSASAYDRPLNYGPGDREAAEQVFMRHPDTVAPAQHKVYEDFILNWSCRLAKKLELPFQIHTGLGQLSGSRPLLFEPTIIRHPDVSFVLFHAGYPWIGETAALAHNHNNVIIDMVWAPIISASAAIAGLHQFIEVAHSSDRIAWGSDTWTSEEAVGALLAWQHVIATVLSQKVESGYFDMSEAEALSHKLMYSNAARLYGLST